jgi:UPF0716 protein FxsA
MLWLFLLFVVAPVVELYVIIQVGQAIGALETIALLIVTSVVGAWLLKRQGLSTLAKISDAVNAGRTPAKELVDGLLLLVAGALMMAPGFIGDALAYLLLLPPTRAPIRALLIKRFSAGQGAAFFAGSGPGGARFIGTFRAGSVFDTTGSATRPDGTARGELEP